jgi:hypothetical protein
MKCFADIVEPVLRYAFLRARRAWVRLRWEVEHLRREWEDT